MKSFYCVLATVALFGTTSAFAHEQSNPSAKVEPQKINRVKQEQRSVQKPLGHSGGTDSSGCHTNHKTGDYHCHKPK